MRMLLLGEIELVTPTGRPVVAILRQRKRLALFLYLAVACPPVFHRRESLLGLFWPDTDPGRARHALRQALYALRKALGKRVLVTRGDEEVGVARGRVWCDVLAFATAHREHRLCDALNLYRGELARSFAAVSPEFDGWLARERDRLRRLAADAAWQLAEDAARSGNGIEARKWFQKACELAPLDEPLLRRHILTLDRFGDRSGAVRAYDRFDALVREKLEVAPSPETQLLIEAMRRDQAVP